MKQVGIPRALFYYYYYPLWKTFFNDLGAEVVLSSPTNRMIIDHGIASAVDETCYPVKVFMGHVDELCSASVDYIFIPRLVSVEPRTYICPKFMGLPDMARAMLPKLPPLIDITVDLSRSDHNFKHDVIRLGRLFGKSSRTIQKAYDHACQELNTFQALTAEGYTPEEAIGVWEGHPREVNNNYQMAIGVLGHGYSLYDVSISMNIIKRLRNMQCRVFLPEHFDLQLIEAEAATLPKRVFWTLGRKMLGTALYLDKQNSIDGIIYLACFGCGPDSLIGEIIERKIVNKPFMMLTVDEHTGEAGLITRLEAFCDMLDRRRSLAGEDNFPAYG